MVSFTSFLLLTLFAASTSASNDVAFRRNGDISRHPKRLFNDRYLPLPLQRGFNRERRQLSGGIGASVLGFSSIAAPSAATPVIQAAVGSSSVSGVGGIGAAFVSTATVVAPVETAASVTGVDAAAGSVVASAVSDVGGIGGSFVATSLVPAPTGSAPALSVASTTKKASVTKAVSGTTSAVSKATETATKKTDTKSKDSFAGKDTITKTILKTVTITATPSSAY